MENSSEIESKVNNLVGIIPIAGHDEFNFEQPWPNCMMPIGPSYSLLDASIVECAYAGCKSIWIEEKYQYTMLQSTRKTDTREIVWLGQLYTEP